MRFISFVCAVALAITASSAFGETPASSKSGAAASALGKYASNTTSIETLLADSSARAVLAKHIPNLVDKLDQSSDKTRTLKDIQAVLQGYNQGELLTDQILAAIDQDLARLAAKK